MSKLRPVVSQRRLSPGPTASSPLPRLLCWWATELATARVCPPPAEAGNWWAVMPIVHPPVRLVALSADWPSQSLQRPILYPVTRTVCMVGRPGGLFILSLVPRQQFVAGTHLFPSSTCLDWYYGQLYVQTFLPRSPAGFDSVSTIRAGGPVGRAPARGASYKRPRSSSVVQRPTLPSPRQRWRA